VWRQRRGRALCGWWTRWITQRPGSSCGRCGAVPGWDTGGVARYGGQPAFDLLGLDSDNGGEFLNHHVLSLAAEALAPVFMTRSRPYKKDDNAHVEQKTGRTSANALATSDTNNPEVVEPINALVKGAYGQLLNYFHASLKLERKERKAGRIKRVYGQAKHRWRESWPARR